MSGQPLPPVASQALLDALEAVGAYRAGYADDEMPALSRKATVALAGLATVALDRLGEAAADDLMTALYAMAHGITVSSS